MRNSGAPVVLHVQMGFLLFHPSFNIKKGTE